MPARITTNVLKDKVNRINSLLGKGVNAVGRYELEANQQGYRVVQVMCESFSIMPISDYLTRKELNLFLTGLITGLTLPTN
ncbi:hypothetical protein [Vibrio cholerae]|uniref:hypothetical protein n=1 Tax=Vibrio phage ICP2_2013_A_Haiti TaxID=1529058 RepID=UPI0004E5BD92|nr:hypothetical protein [Vibrio cholerae]YP_009056238.1 hypothetical protein LD36_gp26 [Vibrio phage ICP2_2013_A_Haiti]AII27140.1 hypothetical protein ICP22013AHaiti_26 [Vibrio phage ICP2_2013_A_Haiti]